MAEITVSVLDPVFMTVKRDTRQHHNMSCCLMCRGDVVPEDVGVNSHDHGAAHRRTSSARSRLTISSGSPTKDGQLGVPPFGAR